MAPKKPAKPKSYSQRVKRQAKIVVDDIKAGNLADVMNNAYPNEGVEIPYGKIYQNFSYNLPAMMVGKLVTEHKKFYDAAITVLETDTIKNLPFVTCIKGNFQEVYVWENLKIDPNYYGAAEELRTISPFYNNQIVKPTADMIEHRRASEHEGQRAAVQDDRLFKFLRRRTRYSITKLLSKYCSGLTASMIRDLGTEIEGALRPVEFIVATTQEQMIEMYSTGPTSCMHPKSESANLWNTLFYENAIHPAFFYLHAETLQPVYLKHKGRVIARTILIKEEGTTDVWYGYPHIYSEGQRAAEMMQEKLKEFHPRACKALGKGWGSFEDVVEVPGYWMETAKDYVCPLPYFDVYNATQSKPLYIAFDVENRTFFLSENNTNLSQRIKGRKFVKITTTNSKSTSGFVFAKRILGGQKCHFCGTPVVDNGILAEDGTAFCCKEHVNLDEAYVPACDVQGNARIMPRNHPELIADAWNYQKNTNQGFKTHWYTNANSLMRNGGRPVMPAFGDPVDNNRMTIAAYQHCTYKNVSVALDEKTWGNLRAGKIVGWKVSREQRIYEDTSVSSNANAAELLEKVNW